MQAALQKKNRTALYERLSKDDEIAGDSTSIQNQRKILRNYAEENGMIVVGEYTDDGWSGTNFNRPGFTQMIEDIEKKKIDCIITKDLSRLGRNYLEVGYYIETFFPSNGIRYIAISDNIDTDRGDSDLAPFMNIFNEFHAKQTSKKLRQVHEMQCEEGDCHYTYPPIGYNKNPENKKRLIPDEESAWIVEKIFELADEQGMGAFSIQKWLFENKVMTPGYREYLRWGAKSWIYENAPEERRYEWGLANIKNILKNQVYLGHTVRYKNRTISFKNKKRRKNDPEDWSIKKNTHQPLVSQERFDRVQKQLTSRRRKNSDGEVQLFAGIARCSDCGHALRFSTNRQRPGFEYQFLSCSSKDSQVINQCTRHYIRYDTLQQIVLQQVQKLYESVKLNKTEMAYKLAKMEKEKVELSQKKEKAEYRKLESRLTEIEKLFPRLYEDWVSSRLTEQMFTMMSNKYQTEQKEIEARISELKPLLDSPQQSLDQAKKWIASIEKFQYPTELTHEIVSSLIDKIVVHEAIGPKGSRKKTQVVEIYWKFIGSID